MSKRRDDELVSATLEGQREAFDELVVRYEAKIFNLALRVTGNPDDAMDTAQAAFLKAYDNLGRFDPARSFFSWIYRIGLNQALNIVNQRRRYVGEGSEVAESAPGPEEECWGHETGREIQAALQTLSPDYRAVVILRHVHGLSYQEMSEVTGVPAKTVKSRLFSARKKLREMLISKGLLK